MTRSSEWRVRENQNKNLLARLTGGDIAAGGGVGALGAAWLTNEQLGKGNELLRGGEANLRGKARKVDELYKKKRSEQNRFVKWFLNKKGIPKETNFAKSVPKYSLSRKEIRTIAGKTGLKAGAGIIASLLAARFIAQRRLPGEKQLGLDRLASKLDSDYMSKKSSVDSLFTHSLRTASGALVDTILAGTNR